MFFLIVIYTSKISPLFWRKNMRYVFFPSLLSKLWAETKYLWKDIWKILMAFNAIGLLFNKEWQAKRRVRWHDNVRFIQENGGWNWFRVWFFIGTTLIATGAVLSTPVFFFLYSWKVVLLHAITSLLVIRFMHHLVGTAIGAGYHRLWSHPSYRAGRFLQYWYACWGAAAAENSIIKWAVDHYCHHRWVDDMWKDPYSFTRGFLFAHIWWVLRDKKNDNFRDDFRNFSEEEIRDIEKQEQRLQKNPVVMFQNRYYTPLLLIFGLVIPVALLVGIQVGFQAFFSLDIPLWVNVVEGVVVAIVRMFYSHQVTFLVNSLAHCFGFHPNEETSPTNAYYFVARFSRFFGILGVDIGEILRHGTHHDNEMQWWTEVWTWDYDPIQRTIALTSKMGLSKVGPINEKKKAKLVLAQAKYLRIPEEKLQQPVEEAKRILAKAAARTKAVETF